MPKLSCLGVFTNPGTGKIFTHTVISWEENWFSKSNDGDYSTPYLVNQVLEVFMEGVTDVFYFKSYDEKERMKAYQEKEMLKKNHRNHDPLFVEKKLFQGKYYMVSIGWDNNTPCIKGVPYIKGVYQDRLFDFDINTNIKTQERLDLRQMFYGEQYYAFEKSLIQKTESGYQFID